MRRTAITTVAVLLFALAPAMAGAKEAWVSVRSPRYLLIGNADEHEVRRAATRFELFRSTFSELFPAFGLNSRVPVRLIVFKDFESYRAFRPLDGGGRPADFAGYFQPGADANYITLPLGGKAEDAYAVAFHEFVHLLIAGSARRVPDWLNEGLAQYYSILDISEDGVVLGRPVARHAHLLRAGKLLPLSALFAIDRESADYAAGERRDLFYAESWALVHYLISSDEGRGQLRLLRFLEMLASGMTAEESFGRAFRADYAVVEKGLGEYVRRGAYAIRRVAAARGERAATELASAPLTEAEAQYYLGDLLLHVGRFEDAERRLARAAELDPELAAAHASLGMALVRQRRFEEAQESLRRALALTPGSYLFRYYYAYALSREVLDEDEAATRGYAPETARAMRGALLKAIELGPYFPESYRLLAFVDLVAGERLNEAVALLKRALQLSPGRADLTFVLAEVYLRQNDSAAARAALRNVIESSANPRLRARALALLEGLAAQTK